MEASISKKNWGQYFTPLKVVRAIVNMADIEPGMSICDPACGVGKFLLEPILHSLDRLYAVSTDEAGNEKLLPQITLSGFDKGFDKDEQKTIILAKANMLIYMSGMIKEHPGLTKQFAELFNKTFTLQTNSILGTLAKPITEEYDLILTNPPYVMSGSSNLKEEIAKDDALKKYFSISAMGIEGLFMEWIIRALKPGKKAFIVVPDGIMNRSNDKKLRDFILEQCNIDSKEKVASFRPQTIVSECEVNKFSLSYLFDIQRGSGKYTKKYIQNHTGEYPLYSGNTTGVFATIDSFDFNCPCLSWAIDGLAGFMMIHNESFSATNHRGVLIPHEDKLGLIDLQYMKYTLEPLFRAAKKGREGDNGENEYTTLPPFMIADIMVPVPVDGQGNISLDAQKEIAAKYLAIEQCKNEVISKLDSLIQQKIEL